MPISSRWALAFPHTVRGRRVARSRGFIPPSGSPSYTRPIRAHEAASFVFVLRPAGLAGTPDWVRGAVSGQVPPRCYHPNAPPAYTPKRAIGVADSFHSASDQFRFLLHDRALPFQTAFARFEIGEQPFVCRAWPGCLPVRSASVPSSKFASSLTGCLVRFNEQVRSQVGNTEG